MDIRIRHLQVEDDYKAVHEMLNSQTVINGTMRLPHASLAYTRQRLAAKEDAIMLVVTADEEVVGYAEMITYPHVPRHRHVGDINLIMVREGWQGKGIGRLLMTKLIELADQWLQITRLALTVWADNERAIQLYCQMGFEIEGTMPAYVFRAGRYVDAYMMGRLLPRRNCPDQQALQANWLKAVR